MGGFGSEQHVPLSAHRPDVRLASYATTSEPKRLRCTELPYTLQRVHPPNVKGLRIAWEPKLARRLRSRGCRTCSVSYAVSASPLCAEREKETACLWSCLDEGSCR